jgi:hypothetical protein
MALSGYLQTRKVSSIISTPPMPDNSIKRNFQKQWMTQENIFTKYKEEKN